jgi:hypothetical protein
VSLSSVTPDRGDSLGGTALDITLNNNPLLVPGRAAELRCRFSAAIAGSSTTTSAVAYSPALPIDEAHLRCVTPDFTAHFAAATSKAALQEVYLSVSELDGSFRTRSELRFRFLLRPQITELTPQQGYASRATQVRLRGQNFVNFKDLSVRAVAVPEIDAGVVEYTWSGAEVLFMDSENLLIEMPAVSTPDGRRTGAANVKVCKQYISQEEDESCDYRLEVRLEVSLNGGVDWATEPRGAPAIFAFLDEPQVVNLS